MTRASRSGRWAHKTILPTSEESERSSPPPAGEKGNVGDFVVVVAYVLGAQPTLGSSIGGAATTAARAAPLACATERLSLGLRVEISSVLARCCRMKTALEKPSDGFLPAG